MFLNLHPIDDQSACSLGVVTDRMKVPEWTRAEDKKDKMGAEWMGYGSKRVSVGEEGVEDGGREYVTCVDRVGTWGD